MSEKPKKDIKLYGRIGVSVVLYALFMIFSVSAVLTGTLGEKPLLLGGLLVGAVLILPRNTRRPSSGDASKEDAERINMIMNWLTWVRASYLIIAVLLWYGLPELL